MNASFGQKPSHILTEGKGEIFAAKLRAENFSVYLQLPDGYFNHRIEPEINYP